MTISNTSVKTSAVGGVTNYSFAFRILADSDLLVYTENSAGGLTLKTLTTDYTVTFVSGVEGGTVIFGVAPSASLNVWIVRDVPDTQGIDYEKNKSIPADSVETSQDKLTMLVQENVEALGRCLKTAVNTPSALDELPLPVAGNILVGNLAETGYENVPLPGYPSEAYVGTGTPSGVVLATFALPDDSGAHLQVFGTGLVGADQDVYSLEVMLSRNTGVTTITVINGIGGLFGSRLGVIQSGDDSVLVAYSTTTWVCAAVVTIRSDSVVTIT